jgi:hypothetical protein
MTAGRIAAALWLAAMIGCRSRPATTPSSGSAATILPSLAFAPAIVELAAPMGDRSSQSARLAGRMAPGARLSIEHIDDPALEVQVLPPDESGAAGLRLTFTGDRAGVRTGQVVVATGLGDPAQLTLLYSLRVPSNVSVTPSNPFLDLRDPGARERRLEVRGRGAAFRVESVQVLSGPFRATVESDGATTGGLATIRVRVDDPALRGNPQRGFVGTLRIRGNDPAQPTTDVPLFAMGALPPHPPAPDAGGQGIPGPGNEPIRGSDATAKAR